MRPVLIIDEAQEMLFSVFGELRVLTSKADLDEFELKGRTALSSTKDGGENVRGDAASGLLY